MKWPGWGPPKDDSPAGLYKSIESITPEKQVNHRVRPGTAYVRSDQRYLRFGIICERQGNRKFYRAVAPADHKRIEAWKGVQ